MLCRLGRSCGTFESCARRVCAASGALRRSRMAWSRCTSGGTISCSTTKAQGFTSPSRQPLRENFTCTLKSARATTLLSTAGLLCRMRPRSTPKGCRLRRTVRQRCSFAGFGKLSVAISCPRVVSYVPHTPRHVHTICRSHADASARPDAIQNATECIVSCNTSRFSAHGRSSRRRLSSRV